MPQLDIHPQTVDGIGAQVGAAGSGAAPPVSIIVRPPAQDPVSVAVTGTFSARLTGITAYSAAGNAITSHRGAMLRASATSYEHQEATEAATLGGGAGMPLGARPAMPTAAIPFLPSLTVPAPALGAPPANGKEIAALIHSGDGPGGLHAAAQQMRTYAADLDTTAARLRAAAGALGPAWSSAAGDVANARIGELAGWFGGHAGQASAAAAALDGQADNFGRARAAIPTPGQFEDLERRLEMAVIANRQPGAFGRFAPVIAQLQSDLAKLHAAAIAGYGGYSAGAGDPDIAGTPLKPPPHSGIQALDVPLAPPQGPNGVADDDRRKNQIEAFKRVFGRAPVSSADWETAAALDPHSYDPKNRGTPPNIVVGRIEPVPGQGVVRSNLFIPSKDVWAPTVDWPPYDNNAGDNRGFSPTVGPEASRVTIYTDFENGVVVARQNPSVNLDTGQVRTGTRSISAIQQANGSVLINYNAADPFSLGGEGLAKGSGISVNGQLAIAPSDAGPRVGGNVTSFPALEIYSDRGGATTPLLQAWPTIRDDAAGPLTGLMFPKPVGDTSLITHFNSVFPETPQPTLPNPHHFPSAQPITPPMSIVPPPPPTLLGPVSDIPQIRVFTPNVIPPP